VPTPDTAVLTSVANGAVRDSTTRWVAVDAFRGLAIASMILVNNPGSWSHVYPPFLHAEWHGWTPTDLIFPFFLFIVGVSVSLSFAKRLEHGQDRRSLLRHVVVRALVLVALGLFMAAFPRFALANLRWPGVLQRIGVAYLLAAPLYLWLSTRGRAAACALLLTGYWAVMTWVPVPGYGPGDLSPDGNLAAFVDRFLMDGHLWSQSRTWDPEGLLSTVPAIATVLFGTFTGDWLRVAATRSRAARDLCMAGGVLMTVGWSWGLAFPINKNLWTSSYTVFTAGAAMVVLAACIELIDSRGLTRWARPFVIYGKNALAVFVASGLVAKLLILTKVDHPDGSSTSFYTWLYESLFLPFGSPKNASLAFALTTVFVWWVVLWLMDRRGIYIKV
jgi:predicted acyltransferase